MKDYFGYKGKTAVVTGAASGMGKAAAEMLVELGAKVYALDYAEVKVDGIEKFIQVNLAQKDSIDNAFKDIPDTINYFFGIAGVSGQQHDFATTFSIDFIANKYITEEYLTERIPSGGAIAFITSEAGLRWEQDSRKEEYVLAVDAENWDDSVKAIEVYKDVPGTLAYKLAKNAMHYYIAKIVTEFGLKKIRVNAILPGATDTGLTDDFAVSAGGRENLEKFTGTAQRLATPIEMAAPLIFLSSDMASYISGALVEVDYGLTLPMFGGLVQDWYAAPKTIPA